MLFAPTGRGSPLLCGWAAGKENKKKLDMWNSVIVNYDSIEQQGSLELIDPNEVRQRITLTREQRRNELLKENETWNPFVLCCPLF